MNNAVQCNANDGGPGQTDQLQSRPALGGEGFDVVVL